MRKKSEMMVASSVQLTVGKVGFCDLTTHGALLQHYDRDKSTVQLCTLVRSNLVHGKWTPMLAVPHVGKSEWQGSRRPWRRIRAVERLHYFLKKYFFDYSKCFHSYDRGVQNTAAT
jgi:hypothetical protein